VRRFLIILFAIIAVVATAAAVNHYSLPLVRVGLPVRGPAVEAVYATGVVEPVTWAQVTPMVRGRIIEMCRCEGQWQKKGDVLARLDDESQRARIAELEARARFLKQDVERYQTLLQNRDISLQTFQRVSSQYDEVQSIITAERKELDEYVLRAPIDGQVLRRDFELGEIVGPGDVLFWVGKPQPLWIVADVDEEDIPRVKPGISALIKVDAFPDEVLDGTLQRITPKGDPINKTFRVYIVLPERTPLKIGMTAEVNLVIREVENALLLPAAAIRDDRVFVVGDGRVQQRAIRRGITGQRTVQIIDGLNDGERVVLDPPDGLSDGSRIRIDEEPRA
jgi:RND family efflux transporter MFP subunit